MKQETRSENALGDKLQVADSSIYAIRHSQNRPINNGQQAAARRNNL
jgi:hypothetical protein